MPTTLPGHLHHQGQGAAPADGQDYPELPRGPPHPGQDRPGRDRHRPGAALHDRDHHHAPAHNHLRKGPGRAVFLGLAGLAQRPVHLDLARGGQRRNHSPVAEKADRPVLFKLAGLAQGAADLDLARRAVHHHSGTGRRPGPSHPVSGPHQRLDHAHQDPDRHALHRHQNTGGHQAHGTRPGGAVGPGQPHRGGGGRHPGDPVGLLRAGHRRQLPRFQHPAG